MNSNNSDICPVEKAGLLDNKIRKLFQNPQKILKPYLKEGMRVLDVGCGPGFFSVEIAKIVGKDGKVYAADLQEGMLNIVKNKINGTQLEERIILHKCGKDSIDFSEKVDFVLAFYMVHEIKEKERFFSDIYNALNENGKFLIIEPKFHVSKEKFNDCIVKLNQAGFKVSATPRSFVERIVLVEKK